MQGPCLKDGQLINRCLCLVLHMGMSLRCEKESVVGAESFLAKPTLVFQKIRMPRTWTPKVCKIMVFMAIIGGLGPLFYILLGLRYTMTFLP